MKVNVILADTGRPTGANSVNLLNAGWSHTGGPPQPAQAVAVFLEAPWNQLNKPLNVVLELQDDNGNVVDMTTPAGPQPASLSQQIAIANTPGAPNGTPGQGTILIELGPGILQLPAGHRYTWRVTVDGVHDVDWEASFWVHQQLAQPHIGGLTPGP